MEASRFPLPIACTRSVNSAYGNPDTGSTGCATKRSCLHTEITFTSIPSNTDMSMIHTNGRIQASIAINDSAGSPTTGHRERPSTSKPPANNNGQSVGRAMPAFRGNRAEISRQSRKESARYMIVRSGHRNHDRATIGGHGPLYPASPRRVARVRPRCKASNRLRGGKQVRAPRNTGHPPLLACTRALSNYTLNALV